MNKQEAGDILKKELALVMQYEDEKPVQDALKTAIQNLEKGQPDHAGGLERCRCGLAAKTENELYRQTITMHWRIGCESGHIKTMWCESLDEAMRVWKGVMA